MITIGIYKFKEEFCKELNIPMNQAERRLDQLLEWLTNFFDFDFIKGHPNLINVKEIIGEYQPIPRKLPDQSKLTEEKIADYSAFTIASLGTEFKPNSRSKIARDAIAEFGMKKYSHTNAEAVSKRYIKSSFNEYGESDNKSIWVYYTTYAPLDEEEVAHWRRILDEEHINERDAANAFYRQEQGEDISKEKQYYKNALSRFKAEYGDFPVLVKSWRLKK